MSAMDTDEASVVLSSNTASGLSVSLHPLPILNISEHLTRRRLQTNGSNPFLLGALLGIQDGREVEIVNTFELAAVDDAVDHDYLISRRDQYKQVFPSLEFIGWYTVASYPTTRHIAIHEQFTGYCSTPLLLLLQPGIALGTGNSLNAQALPFKAYEPSIEIRERTSRAVYIEVPYAVETGEAERIAVDWTAKGGGTSTSLETHLQTERSAVKMLHDRLLVLVKYVTEVIAGQAPKDYATLRSLSALVASLPATENVSFRDEFDTEYEDVQLTAILSSLTKSTNNLNDFVDKHNVLSASRDERSGASMRRKQMGKPGGFLGDWDRQH
ncbi:maintenance of mitochondrial structure and function-domain-containing protein [Amanita rubescens]|nr:maintenance of mitochondrial structure and function-domain-containing protein [Amanita rubescens]